MNQKLNELNELKSLAFKSPFAYQVFLAVNFGGISLLILRLFIDSMYIKITLIFYAIYIVYILYRNSGLRKMAVVFISLILGL